jgi:uroporphyrinogen decarboxylase
MTSRERFHAALACDPLERPPLWVMRQAGRYLPEYRALKAKSSFLEMVRTPALAAEVTLQPLRRFPGLDAAILFSDILVIPEALGQGYAFRDTGGIGMDYRLETRAQIDALAPAEAVPERLAYVTDTLALLKEELAGQKMLLGFGGSPWTLATYMVEGGSGDQGGAEGFGGGAVPDAAHIRLFHHHDGHQHLHQRCSDHLERCRWPGRQRQRDRHSVQHPDRG